MANLNMRVRREMVNLAFKHKYGFLYTSTSNFTYTDGAYSYWKAQSEKFGKKWGMKLLSDIAGGPSGIRRLRSAPDGWFDRRSHFSLMIEINKEERATLHINLPKPHPIPFDLVARYKKANKLPTFEANKEEMIAASKSDFDLRKEWQMEFTAMLEALKVFRTSERLKEDWPEAYSLYKKAVKSLPGETTALTFSRNEINEKFGLPI